MQLPNSAKAILALSMVAYAEGDHEQAGMLFAQSMSMHDSEELVDSMLVDDYTLNALGCSLSAGEDLEDLEFNLESIAAQINIGSEEFRKRLASNSGFEDEDDLDGFSSDDDSYDDSDDDSDEDFDISESNSKSPLSLA